MKLLVSWAAAALALSGSVSALGLRDNVNTGDNTIYTGFPNNTAANPGFDYADFETSGVGWYVQDTRRQFAMVSPLHFVCANHFRPGINGQVRFLGTDNVERTYEILKTEVIVDASSGATDLCLGTLEEAVDTSVIHPVAYANLGSDASYAGPGIVFGKTVRAGKTSFGGVTTTSGTSLTGSEQIDNTRFINLVYSFAGVDGDDAFLEAGDSGSPSFLDINGELALVGTNSAVIDNLGSQAALAAFVPFYVDELNAFMEDDGYQMREATPGVTSLTAQGASVGTLRQAYAGEWTLDIANEGVVRANNLMVTLSGFTQEPDQATGPDFFGGPGTGGSFERHRAFLENGESTSLTLRWNELPAQETISFQVAITADEGEVASFTVELNLLPSFRLFVSGLTLQGELDDEDGDGVANLLEYALGGDVSTRSALTPEGTPLLQQVTLPNETVEVSFLRRTDSLSRGLTYQVLHSADLIEWEQALFDDLTLSEAEEEGFQKVAFIQNTPADFDFFVLSVTLDEDPSEDE